MRQLLTALSVFAVSAGSVSANPALRDVPKIENAIFDVSVADKIRKKCDDLAPRMTRALSLYSATKQHARELGYSKEEIDSYTKSKTEKLRIRAKRDAYLSAQGVVREDPQSYCAVGRKEIQKSSRIGSLLKEK